MPVLPLVGSTSVSPDSSSPTSSAASTIDRTGRSFADPPGLNDSIFAAIVVPAGLSTLTSGDPMVSRMLSLTVCSYVVTR